MENKHTLSDLKQMQSLPLSAKIAMTKFRIRGWVEEYGEDGVYISFSGGKDSTVLMDIVRNECGYKNIPAVFVDVPTQYPELKSFAKKFDDVEILRPSISFVEVCEKYGFPLISKEVSHNVYGAREYYKQVGNLSDEELEKYLNDRILNRDGGSNIMLATILGWRTTDRKNPVKIGGGQTPYNMQAYKFMLDSPFSISDKCCSIMKKKPIHDYNKKTGRKPMTAQMADESRLRRQQWMKNGCNGFDMKSPISNPMSFWTEQDVLKYIYQNNLEICSVYGKITDTKECEGQMDLFDSEKKYKCTGLKRTGCMMCGFGCHLCKNGEKNQFEILKETHPKMYGLLDICKNNGVTFREAIEWTNEHGNLNIRL